MAMTLREFINAYNRLTSHGWLTLDEALLLAAMAEETNGPMLEIGCYQGRSSMLLAQLREQVPVLCYGGQTWENRQRQLYCIDPWDDSFSDLPGSEVYERFCANIASIGAIVSVERCRAEDLHLRPWWSAFCTEFAYLDGDHTYAGTRMQISRALECIPKVICIHDVNDSGDGAEIKRAAIEILGPWTERVGRLAAWRVR